MTTRLSSFIVYRSSFYRWSLALFLLCAPSGCAGDTTTAPASPSATATSSSPAAATTSPVASASDMHFDAAIYTIKGKPFTLEIADTDAKSERGLMYRDSMPADHGMIFIFPTPVTTQFWMKNTRIPLDIIFLDPKGKVVGIDHRLPFDLNGHGPTSEVLNVIELNVGTAQKIGLQLGDVIDLTRKDLKAAPATTEK